DMSETIADRVAALESQSDNSPCEFFQIALQLGQSCENRVAIFTSNAVPRSV
ncbi:hypothetical protein CEXT_210261, partial [Caerostris extrusa]